MGLFDGLFGSKDNTTTTKSKPWGAAQPALKAGLGAAQNLFENDIGGNFFPGSTAIPFDKRTGWGMNAQMQGARGAQGDFNANFNQVAANAANGGLNKLQNQQVGRLQQQAGGGMLFNNPNVQKMIDLNARDIGASSNLMASAAGRYGSGAHQGVTERNVGDMATQVRADDYGRERGYQQDAIGQLFNAGQQQQANINSNAGFMQDAYGAMMQPGQTMMDIGGQYEDLATRRKNDELRKFQGNDMAGWNRIGLLNNVATGAGGMGGTQSTTAQGPSRLQSGIGGALGGFDMSGGNPWGALLGGMGGLFG